MSVRLFFNMGNWLLWPLFRVENMWGDLGITNIRCLFFTIHVAKES